MLKLRLTTVLIILGFSLYSFISKKTNKNNPPGTQLFKGIGYYVDERAVTIGDWQEFYYYEKKYSSEDVALKLLPDTNLVKSFYNLKDFSNKMLLEKFDKPIVGVSVEQILEYCKFRSEAVNIKYKENITYLPLNIEVYDFLHSHV